uniref:HTH CENPB-type domain-containing protein n=1 Tax=Echinostoma caproni TaxID=27848 RepID=A0A183ASH9_9TREM
LMDEIETRLANESTPLVIVADFTDVQWSRIKAALQQAGLNNLGTTKRCYKDWISEETIRRSILARNARLAGHHNYQRLRREATRSAKADRRKYWNELANKMETAASACHFGDLFRVIRSASVRRQYLQPVLRDSTGGLISDIDGRMTRWVEHFSRLLCHPLGNSVDMHLDMASPYEVGCDPPTMEEIAAVIGRLKSGKAPGTGSAVIGNTIGRMDTHPDTLTLLDSSYLVSNTCVGAAPNSVPHLLIRQESNSHRNCELPPVPSGSDYQDPNVLLASNRLPPALPYNPPSSGTKSSVNPIGTDPPMPNSIPGIASSEPLMSRLSRVSDDPQSESDGLYASVGHSATGCSSMSRDNPPVTLNDTVRTDKTEECILDHAPPIQMIMRDQQLSQCLPPYQDAATESIIQVATPYTNGSGSTEIRTSVDQIRVQFVRHLQIIFHLCDTTTEAQKRDRVFTPKMLTHFLCLTTDIVVKLCEQ